MRKKFFRRVLLILQQWPLSLDPNVPQTGNRKSIAVEICYSKSGGARYRAAEALAIKFVAQLLKERGWGVDKIRKHQDWNGKYCPHRILSEGGQWSL